MYNKLIILFLVISISGISISQAQNLHQKNANTGKGSLAIEGYDPVSYFNGKPLEGVASKTLNYEGVVYRFATDENKAAFQKNPAAYEPQYGGWCAYAMGANGEKVEVDPETYKIIEEKLYLFYNKYLNNTLKTWNKNETALKQKADANWAKFNH